MEQGRPTCNHANKGCLRISYMQCIALFLDGVQFIDVTYYSLLCIYQVMNQQLTLCVFVCYLH